MTGLERDMAGYGEGWLTLTPENPGTGEPDPAMETDMPPGLEARI